MKCVECGTEFDDSVKTCPNCGCPVINDSATGKVADTPSAATVLAEKKSSRVFKINFVALIALVLGAAILFMGFNLKNKQFDIDIYNASKYSVDSVKFGADFYTEIYKASDVAVDAISAVNGGIASLSGSVADFAEVVSYSTGMIVIAIGMGVIAVSLLHIRKKG